MASRPAPQIFSPAEVAYGGLVARGLYALSAVLLVLLMAWSAGPA